MYPGETLAQAAKRRLEDLKSSRESYDAHAKDISKFFDPWRGRWQENTTGSRGNKKNQSLIDPTAKMALRTLASGMMAGSTNPAQPWFSLRTADPEMMEIPSVSRWLYTVENRMRDIFDRSNLYKALPNIYAEAGAFGTSLMILVQDDEKVLRCIEMTFGTYWIAQDEKGRIDTLYRIIKYTTRQMVKEFGLDNCSPQVQAMFKEGAKEQYHDVLHCIEPRKERDTRSRAAKDMPFASRYFDMDWQEKPLRDSGFEGNPIASFRWGTVAEDIYGFSPAMDALGSAKALQVQVKRKAQAIDKHIDPPLVGDPGQKNETVSQIPGEVSYHGFTANGSAPKLQPLYQVKPDLQGLLEDIEDTRTQLNDCMYVPLFLPLTTLDRREITAEEVRQRAGESLLMLGPTLGNHKGGLIEPLIEWTFALMIRESQPVWDGIQNDATIESAFIPEPPEELQGASIKVEMISPLAVAQKQSALGSIDRVMNTVAILAKAQADAGQEPTVFDKLDLDQTVDEVALATGVPPSMIRSDEDVADMRAQRAQAAQQQQMMQAAPALKDAADAGKALSETKIQGESILDRAAA